MGTQTRAKRSTGLSDALFTLTQQRVLWPLFAQPSRSYYATELIALAGPGSGTVQRELARLEQSGLVTVRHVGKQKHYQANPHSPIYEELCGIARKTFGLAEPLKEALSPFANEIVAAFVHGSVAKRNDTSASDIDVMIVSDTILYSELYAALETAGQKLGRRVNPTVYSREHLAQRVHQENAFMLRVLDQPKVWLIRSEGTPAELFT
jgi:predicted nucleotidyltransferase